MAPDAAATDQTQAQAQASSANQPSNSETNPRQIQRQAVHLPTSIVSTGDARRLKRDLAALEDTLQAMRLRTNSPVAKLPRMSRFLEEFASTNRLNFLLPEDRHRAAVFVDFVIKHAPVMHISFASEATRRFTTELIVWLRTNYDSEMLIEIGLEPNIAAGCVVRTTNKMFDFSLINHLKEKRPMLTDMLLKAVARSDAENQNSAEAVPNPDGLTVAAPAKAVTSEESAEAVAPMIEAVATPAATPAAQVVPATSVAPAVASVAEPQAVPAPTDEKQVAHE